MPNKTLFTFYLRLAHRNLATLHAPGRYFARLRGYPRNISGTRRGKQDLRRLLSGKAKITPIQAWDAFEAFRLSGVDWSSGILGLAAAGYAHELIGLHYVVSVTHDQHSATVNAFTNLMFAADSIVGAPEIEWPFRNSFELRLCGFVDSEQADAIATAWATWKAMPRDFAQLALNLNFPINRYAWAVELRDAFFAFLLSGGEREAEAYIIEQNKRRTRVTQMS